MFKRQSGKKHAPSGISQRVGEFNVHDPDVSDGDVPTGARISPNLQGPLHGLQRKRNINHTQTRPAMENATTMEVRKAPSQLEQHAQIQPVVTARYNLRSNTNHMANMGDACDSHRRFRAASHLASAVVNGDFFTYLALDEITESVTDTSLILSPMDNQKADYIPPNRRAMLKCKYRVKWEEAEADELRSFSNCDVMTKYPPPPNDVKVLPLKWIYTIKKDLKGIIIRYKARLVAQGFFQVFGVDYTDTYSPVAKFVSIRIMLAISMQLGLIVHTMDVDTAFLNAPLEEHIWVKIPDGTNLADGDNGIYKLIKSLYGLKQASRCWNNLINDYLIESGFQRLEADPCIYVREIKVVANGQTVIKFQIVALYVDDLIIAASNKNLITDLEKVFEARFKMKKLNKIKQILGMGVHHDKDRNIIYITQQQYIEDSAKRFAKYGISEFRTPMDDRLQLSKQQMPKEGSPEALQMATFPYRELIGTLLWISNGTRPDIVFPVNTLAKYTHNPALIHWRAALRVLGYLKATKNYCIRYAQQLHQDSIVSTGYMRGILPEQSDFKCYVDASHASDLDTRRSITGYIFFVSGGPVSWQSRMQTSVALSSMEAEYMAASAATQEALWQARLLQQLGMRIQLPITLYEDNKSAIMFADHPGDHRTTKHIDTRKKFAREAQNNGDIKLEYIPTADQLADGMTKALPTATFQLICLNNYLHYHEFEEHW